MLKQLSDQPERKAVEKVGGSNNKKKIDKSIDFLRGWEKKMVSIFRLRSREKVEVS